MGFPRHSAGTVFDISVRSPRLFVPGCFPPWLDLCVLNGPTAGVTSVSKLVVWWLREQQQQQQQRGEGPLRLFRLSMTFTSWKVAALLYIKLSILPSQHGGAELLIWLPAPYHSSPPSEWCKRFQGDFNWSWSLYYSQIISPIAVNYFFFFFCGGESE
jgi:hypothetical protein